MRVLGIDLGTSGIRCGIYNEKGELIFQSSGKISLNHQVRNGDVQVDMDPLVYCELLKVSLRGVLEQNEEEEPIAAISFAVQGEAMLITDWTDRPLSVCPVSMDRRGIKQCLRLNQIMGNQFVDITGQPLHPMFPIFRISELRKDAAVHSALQNKEWRLLTLDSWIISQIGLSPTTDWTIAARTGFYNVNKNSWETDLLEFAGVSEKQLPQVLPPGSLVGEISQKSLYHFCSYKSRHTEAQPPIKVVVGSHDQASAWWGLGGNANGIITYSMGSSDCLTQASHSRPKPCYQSGLASYPISEDTWLTLAGTAAGGWATSWLANLLYPDADNPVEKLAQNIAVEPAPVLVLPYHCGSGTLDNQPHCSGMISGLSLNSTKADLGRAMLEASGYEMSRILEETCRLLPKVKEIRVAGGGATAASVQLRAEALGLTLSLSNALASLRGAALQALKPTMGLDLSETDRKVPLADLHCFYPEKRNLEYYSKKRELYSLLAKASILQSRIQISERK